MRFFCSFLEEPIKLDEGKINVLVMENPIALRNVIQSIMERDSKIVLSENFKPVEIDKYLELINNIFDVDFVSKNIMAKINSEINTLCMDYHKETDELFEMLNSFGNLISANLDFPVKFSFVQEPDKITKLLSFSIDTEEMTMAEKLLEYMNICRRYFKKKVFVYLNLKCFMSLEELSAFYKNISYEGYRVLLIESYEHNGVDDLENTVVIDDDLCII